MSTRIEVPTELAGMFRESVLDHLIDYAHRYKDEAASVSQKGEFPEFRQTDLDMHLRLSGEIQALAKQIADPDRAEFTGSAHVLSDVCDQMLAAMVEGAEQAMKEPPIDYAKVVEAGGKIASWAKVCEAVDREYREAEDRARAEREMETV